MLISTCPKEEEGSQACFISAERALIFKGFQLYSLDMELKATKRAILGKGVQELRKEGMMPGIVYGPKQEATPITMPLRDFTKTLEKAGESTVIALSVDGSDMNVLIHEVDRDPVTDTPRHADFYAVQKGQKVSVYVPIEFTGVAPAVKEADGNLVKVLHEIEIEAEATNLPHGVTIDVSGLATIDSQILAGDIALPEGVTLITGPEEVVALIAAANKEEDVIVAAPDMAAIDISEERGKKEEEAGTEAEAPKE
jgi:large subunit ribosomal protein L25